MKNRITHALALVSALLIASCSSDKPIKGEPLPSSPPSAGPSSTPPSPSSEPDAPDAGTSIAYCDAIHTWCPVEQWAVWPLGEHEAEWLGQEQQCYCSCDVHADCANSPQSSECGYVFDIVQGPDGPMKKQRFDYPTVCRYTEFQQAH